MVKKSKPPTIEPQFIKDKKTGTTKTVYLDYIVYKSILKEVADLEQKIKVLQKKSLLPKTASKSRKL